MIYFLQRADGAIKIGSTRRYSSRKDTLQTEHGKLTLLGHMDGMLKEERTIQRQFSDCRIHRKAEWFNPTPELLDFIKQNTKPGLPPRDVVVAFDSDIEDMLRLLKETLQAPTISAALREALIKAYPGLPEAIVQTKKKAIEQQTMRESVLKVLLQAKDQ